jgi:hypothetical protein
MMKRLLPVSLLLLFVPVVAFAQLPPPVITSVSPAGGPAAGGNDVTITGSGLTANILCILPCPTIVSFGDIPVPAREESATRLVVTAPAHAGGTVDITVRLADGVEVTKPAAYTFAASAEDNWEKVLLPVYLDAPLAGSNGTRWDTDFWLRNNGGQPVQLAPWPCETEVCPAVVPFTTTVPAGTTRHDLPPFFRAPNANPSRVLFVSKPGAKDVSMQLRVADASRAALNGGTELPVVRDGELLTGIAELLNVPYDPAHFRLSLRIYDLAYSQSKFRVTLYVNEDGGPTSGLHSIELTAATDQTGDFRSQAAYVEYNFGDLESLNRAFPNGLRVEIAPQTPGSRYYPLISVTNNETQLITLVTPQ